MACKRLTVQPVSCKYGGATITVSATMKKSAQSYYESALAFEQQQDWSSAARDYGRAVEANPDFLEAHHNRAAALRRLGRADEALAAAMEAVRLAPDHPTVLLSLGLSQEQTGSNDDAMKSYRNVLAINPDHVAALNNLGRLLESQNLTPEAAEILQKAYMLAPDDAGVLTNLANTNLQRGQPLAAIDLLDRAIKASPDLAVAYNSRGIARHILGRNKEAIEDFNIAIGHLPEFAEAHENLAQILLYEGHYEEAWLEYEWRWKNPSNIQTKRLMDITPWDGGGLDGRTLLVHAEQGFGDCIQFARFIPQIDKGRGKVIFACHQSLLPLMESMGGIDALWDINGPLPDFDEHISLISLPRLFETGIGDVPYKTPYVKASGDQPRLPDNLAGVKNIGFAWAGRPRHEFDPYRNRSCPIEAFEKLTLMPNTHFFSLQTGEKADDIAVLSEKHTNITDLSPLIADFSHTSALISQLDLIITVDTALAHLAGALAAPCFVLLANSSDWRWQSHNGNPAMWYPTHRYFRQDTPGDWDQVMEKIATALNS